MLLNAAAPTTATRFRTWRRRRPFWGGVLTALGGIELFFSGQLDLGRIHVQLGIEGLQATIIPLVLVLLGALIVAMPAHRVFYGIIALAVAVYSLVGVNLGGFFVGMVLSSVGGVLAVAWMPRGEAEAAAGAGSEAEVAAGSEAGIAAEAVGPAAATLPEPASAEPHRVSGRRKAAGS